MTTNTLPSPDFSKELRETYLGAVPHTIFIAGVWIAAGAWGLLVSKSQAIVVFIAAASFSFLGGELLRKIMGVRNVMSKENRLGQLFMMLAFTIPLSYPLIYLVCKANVNLFFSSFTILIGAHYLPFIFGYRMPTFGILSIILVLTGTFFSIYYPSEFALPAFATGGTLLVFAVIHYALIKKQLV